MSGNACEWLLDRHVSGRGGARLAFRTTTGLELSYEELLARVEAMAAGLRGRGVQTGDRVVLAMLDSPEFTASFLAALRIGAIPVLVNPLLPWRDIGVVVEDAKADLVLVSEERQEGSEEVGAPRLVTGSDEWAAVSGAKGDGSLAPTEADSPGFWLCTSGSTGRPKLAMHRHGDLQVTADTYARSVLDVGADDVFFSVGPMFHAYGLGNSLTFPMAVGALTVLEAKRPPTPPRIAEIVTQHRPSLFFAIPAFYAALNASSIPDDTFRSVRLAVSAAEALPAETWHRFHDRFGVEILDGIGSTEMTHIFLSNRAGAVRPGTTGSAVSGYEVRVVDDDGRRSRRRRPRATSGSAATRRRRATSATPTRPSRHSGWEVAGSGPATPMCATRRACTPTSVVRTTCSGSAASGSRPRRSRRRSSSTRRCSR